MANRNEIRIASFKRTSWGEFKSLPPELQAIKDRLCAIADATRPAPVRIRRMSSRGVPGIGVVADSKR